MNTDTEKKILREFEKPERGDPDNHPDFLFWCPGCKHGHAVWVTERNRKGATWTFNGNMEKPTFSPSILLESHVWTPPVTPENLEEWNRKPWPQTKVPKVCHLYVRDGQLEFLPDCTHELRGKTVPMEPF